MCDYSNFILPESEFDIELDLPSAVFQIRPLPEGAEDFDIETILETEEEVKVTFTDD